MTSQFNISIILVFGLVALCFQGAQAHIYLSAVYLNNDLLDEGDCVRPHPAAAFDSPISSLTAPDMTCGWLPSANNPANRKCPIAAGSSIGIQWHHNANTPSDDIVDPSHVGPIIFYLAKSDTGAGNVWFKIYEDGFSNGGWAVTRLIANRGRVDFTIPSDIAPGNYLLRGEVLALHGAYALNGVQPYVSCVELQISGSGSANPTGVAFPGYYKNTDPGMLMSVYQPFTQYIIPGPALYVSGSSSGSSTPTTRPTNAPTNAPTTKPTNAPNAPTNAPTSAPTTRPTTAPTSSPASGNVFVGLNSGSSSWWLAVMVSGGGTTVKVELTDSGSVTSWVSLVDVSYAYVYDPTTELKAPISLRLTSSTGNVLILTNVFTTFSTGGRLIDSGKTYTSTPATTNAPTVAPTVKPTTAPTNAPTNRPTTAPTTAPPTTKPTTAPTNAPVTPKPTTAPATSAPTTPPSSVSTRVTVYPTASSWWFALTLSSSVSKVEIKDSGVLTSYTTMTFNAWGPQEVYTYSPSSDALVTPISVRITTISGKVEIASISSITANAVFTASS